MRLMWESAAVALLLACAQVQAQQEACSVEGRVVNNVTGAAVRRATLTLTGASAIKVAVESGDNGQFAFPGLVPGRYTLAAERTGFISRSGSPLVLTAAQRMKGVVLKLAPAAAISGRVVGEDGEPMAVPLLAVLFQASYQRGVRHWLPLKTTPVNDLGEFRLPNLTAGSYLVAAQLNRNPMAGVSARAPAGQPEREYATMTYFPSTADPAKASAIPVAAGEEASGKVVQMLKVEAVRIAGKVAGGAEGRQVIVRLIPKGAASPMLATLQGMLAICNGNDGSFEMTGVAPGAYSLMTWLSNGPGAQLFANVPLQVAEQDIEGLILQPAPAADLAGAIVVADRTPAERKGIRVDLEARGWPGFNANATVDERGMFTVKNIAPTEYRMALANLPEGWYVKSMRYGEQDVSEGDLDLSGGVTGSLQITVSAAGAQVDGVVRGADDKPVSGATVVLVPDSRRHSLFKETRAGEDGSYSIKGVAPGEYAILAWEDIESGAYEDPEVLKPFESQAAKLSLKDSDHKNVPLTVISSRK
jgi:hypothetical protein